ncbi:MAG: hypothetical protein KQJ78_07625 [Deltaproteobacteria bacterium]|nr:hypothetical protein [Deltaproteobacteria bacterium]
MKLETLSEKQYRGRIWADEAIKGRLEADVETLFHAALGGVEYRWNYQDGGFPPHICTSCSTPEAGWCPNKMNKKSWELIVNGKWVFFGVSQASCMLKAIDRIVCEGLFFPRVRFAATHKQEEGQAEKPQGE